MTLSSVVTLLMAAASPIVAPADQTATQTSAPSLDESGWPCEASPKPLAPPTTYWPDVARPAVAAWPNDATVVTVAQNVSRRGVPDADAVAAIHQFTAARPAKDDRAKLAAAVIDQVAAEQRTMIDSIWQFNARQTQLAKRIEAGYTALDTKDGAATPEQRAAIEEQAGWDQRIFEDRQRMLPILCRQPAALERRLTTLLAALQS